MTTNIPTVFGGIDSDKRSTDLSADGDERFHQIAQRLSRCDFRGREFEGADPQGCRIFLIGESGWSRALAVHPKDPPGIVYLLKDDGADIDITKPVEVEKTMWLNELVWNSHVSVWDALEPGRHRNNRLSDAKARA